MGPRLRLLLEMQFRVELNESMNDYSYKKDQRAFHGNLSHETLSSARKDTEIHATNENDHTWSRLKPCYLLYDPLPNQKQILLSAAAAAAAAVAAAADFVLLHYPPRLQKNQMRERFNFIKSLQKKMSFCSNSVCLFCVYKIKT